jgi:hypothetical protein
MTDLHANLAAKSASGTEKKPDGQRQGSLHVQGLLIRGTGESIGEAENTVLAGS